MKTIFVRFGLLLNIRGGSRQSSHAYIHACVCGVRSCVRVCVCVCVCERERERERVGVRVFVCLCIVQSSCVHFQEYRKVFQSENTRTIGIGYCDRI